jgi:hypothetical protein
MYRSHFGDALVESTTESPTYNALPVGLIESVRGVPFLDAIASGSRDGQHLYILAIKIRFNQPVHTSISIAGAAPGPGMAWTLSGTAIDATTGTELRRGIDWGTRIEIDRFSHGEPEEVWIHSAALPEVASRSGYTLPPHSITALEIQ